MRTTLLRFRPAGQMHQGLSLDDLRSTINAIDGFDLVSSESFEVSAFTSHDSDDRVRLGMLLVDLCTDSQLLVLDHTFHVASEREFLLGWIVSGGIASALSEHDTLTVLVLGGELPLQDDDIARVARDCRWDGRVAFATLSGMLAIAPGCRADDALHLVVDAVAGSVQDLPWFDPVMPSAHQLDPLMTQETILGRPEDPEVSTLFMRGRGVYSMDDPKDPQNFFLFHYFIHDEDWGVQELARRLCFYFEAEKVDVVVFDSRQASRWFGDAINAACHMRSNNHKRIGWIDMADLGNDLSVLDNGDSLRTNVEVLKRRMGSPSSTTCLLVPALNRARSLHDLHARLSAHNLPKGAVVPATVLLNDELSYTVTDAVGGAARVEVELPGATRTVDCFARVRIPSFDHSDWKAGAALESPGGVVFPRSESPSLSVSSVAMWSLYEEYGVDVEPLDVTPGGRQPVLRFPQLYDLDEWDAHWLAEGIVSRFEEHLGLERGEFLVVLPIERNATERISKAMDEKCGVRVAKVSRDSINDSPHSVSLEIQELISKYKGHEIAVFDESTISGGTIAALIEIVHSITQEYPLAVGTVVDLTRRGSPLEESIRRNFRLPGRRPLHVFSLQHWSYLAEGVSS